MRVFALGRAQLVPVALRRYIIARASYKHLPGSEMHVDGLSLNTLG